MMDEVDEGIGSNENSNNSIDDKNFKSAIEDLIVQNSDIMLGKDTNGDIVGVKECNGQSSQPCEDSEHISEPGVCGKGVVDVGPTLNGDSDVILCDSDVNGSAMDKEAHKDEDSECGSNINKANLDLSKLPIEERTVKDLEDENSHKNTDKITQPSLCNSDETTHVKTLPVKQFLYDAKNSLKLLASKVRPSPDRKPGSDVEHNSEAHANHGNSSERLTFDGTDGPDMLEDDGTVQSTDNGNMSAEMKDSIGNMEDLPKESVRLKEADNGIHDIANAEEDLLKDNIEDGIPMEIGSDDENQLLYEPDEKETDRETDRISTKESPLQDVGSEPDIDLSEENSAKCVLDKDVSGVLTAGIETIETEKLPTTEKKLDIATDKPAESVSMDGDAKEGNVKDVKSSDDMKKSQENPVVVDDDDVIFNGESKLDTSSATETNDKRKSSTAEDKKPVNSVDDDRNSISIDVDDDSDVIFEKEVKVDNKNKELINTTIGFQTTETKCTKNVDESVQKNQTDEDAKESKCAENSPALSNPSCDKKDPMKEDESCSVNDRKRRAETETSSNTGTDSKRSRLDLGDLIGKLGSRVEPVELSDSDNDENDSATDDAPEKEAAISDEDEEEEAAKSKEESGNKNQKIYRLTEEELDALVREKVKAYLASQHDSLVAQLSQKMKDLGLKNTLWKQQVKDLQVRVNDVTILQCRQEKRKAKAEALRQISTRHVAVQVDDGKMLSRYPQNNYCLASLLTEHSYLPAQSWGQGEHRTSSSQKPPPPVTHKPPPSPVGARPVQLVTSPQAVASSTVTLITSPTANGTIRLPIPQSSLPPPVLTAQAPQATQLVSAGYKVPTVKSLLDNTRVQPTIGSSSVATPTTGITTTPVISMVPYQQGYIAVQQSLANPTAPLNLTQTVSLPKVVTKPTTTIATVALAAPGTTSKIIDLTDDEDILKPRLVALPPGMQAMNPQLTGVRQVLANSQLVRAAGRPNGTAYQLVFNSPSVRPGTMIASVTQPGAVFQTVGQTTAVPLSSPMVLSPGTSLARAATPLPPPQQPVQVKQPQHPAPFPAVPADQKQPGQKDLPPKPSLKISRVEQGIVLSWTMTLSDGHAEVSNYQLFAYQETSALPAHTLWKKVGDVKALPLPMACTLTQFQVGNKYHFAVRAMDTLNRVGMFSDPSSIHLTPKPTSLINK